MDIKRHYKNWFSVIMVIFFIQNMTFAQGSIQLLMRADDMGKNYGRTMGIIKAHKEGIITSASIMPTSAYFEEAVRFCKANPDLAVGIHLTIADVTQRPVLSPETVPSIVGPKGFFYENVDQLEQANPKIEEIEKELRAQIGKVRATGLHFVYLDWHRSVSEAVQDLILKICHEQKLIYGQVRDGSIYGYTRITLAQESWPKQKMPDGEVVYYAALAIDEQKQQSFFDALNNLEQGRWMTAVHPGLAEPERASITELMCSPRTKEIIKKKNIQLVSYYDLWEEEYGKAK